MRSQPVENENVQVDSVKQYVEPIVFNFMLVASDSYVRTFCNAGHKTRTDNSHAPKRPFSERCAVWVGRVACRTNMGYVKDALGELIFSELLHSSLLRGCGGGVPVTYLSHKVGSDAAVLLCPYRVESPMKGSTFSSANVLLCCRVQYRRLPCGGNCGVCL